MSAQFAEVKFGINLISEDYVSHIVFTINVALRFLHVTLWIYFQQ